MAKPKLDEEVVRVHFHIYKDDHEFLQQFFRNKGGVANAVRTIIRKTRRQLEANVTNKIGATPNE